MKELTRIYDLQITIVTELSDYNTEIATSDYAKEIMAKAAANLTRRLLNADHAKVKVHDFILDKE